MRWLDAACEPIWSGCICIYHNHIFHYDVACSTCYMYCCLCVWAILYFFRFARTVCKSFRKWFLVAFFARPPSLILVASVSAMHLYWHDINPPPLLLDIGRKYWSAKHLYWQNIYRPPSHFEKLSPVNFSSGALVHWCRAQQFSGNLCSTLLSDPAPRTCI